jgi:preprotein translocase subunit SecD
MRQAAEVGWSATRRTLLAADFVTLLAAVVLYIISVGNVKGFAFTLGLITLIDIFVAFLFTYPLTVLVCRSAWMQKATWLTGLRVKGSGRDAGGDAAADDRKTVGVES